MITRKYIQMSLVVLAGLSMQLFAADSARETEEKNKQAAVTALMATANPEAKPEVTTTAAAPATPATTSENKVARLAPVPVAMPAATEKPMEKPEQKAEPMAKPEEKKPAEE